MTGRSPTLRRRTLLAAGAACVLREGLGHAASAESAPLFVNDVRLPGLLHAVVARPPLPGWRLAGLDTADAQRVPGVVGLVRLDPLQPEALPGVAVLARDTWSALRGRDALVPSWIEGESPEAVPDRAAGFVPATAEALLLPPGAVAAAGEGACTVWACLERPWRVRETLAALLGWPASAVDIRHCAPGPGDFVDPVYALDAARLSRACGAPVSLLWTREDDLPFRCRPAGRPA